MILVFKATISIENVNFKILLAVQKKKKNGINTKKLLLIFNQTILL